MIIFTCVSFMKLLNISKFGQIPQNEPLQFFQKIRCFFVSLQKLIQAWTWYTLAYKILNNIHGSVKNALKNCVISKHFVDHSNKLFRKLVKTILRFNASNEIKKNQDCIYRTFKKKMLHSAHTKQTFKIIVYNIESF